MFHRHRWRAIGATQINLFIRDYWTGKTVDTPQDLYTHVHLQCEGCGDVKSKKVAGHWTTEELRGA